MILPYILRLVCLTFASFFLIYAALSLAAWIVAPSAIRLGESLNPHFAARLLLILRLSPVAVAAFIVSALCVPSYLWLEPDASAERVGIACCFAHFSASRSGPHPLCEFCAPLLSRFVTAAGANAKATARLSRTSKRPCSSWTPKMRCLLWPA